MFRTRRRGLIVVCLLIPFLVTAGPAIGHVNAASIEEIAIATLSQQLTYFRTVLPYKSSVLQTYDHEFQRRESELKEYKALKQQLIDKNNGNEPTGDNAYVAALTAIESLGRITVHLYTEKTTLEFEIQCILGQIDALEIQISNLMSVLEQKRRSNPAKVM
ncbi:MAG: hypothetical protein KKF41_03670 [Actinobacteria bacterium]|nr:hypothetical protein [Actinomycetota bacterium]MBU1945000.1 hypothetical protein [Actinomycetota bacterium]MBU2686664.1 hypothetical protein [Actinomycetota bacterium]